MSSLPRHDLRVNDSHDTVSTPNSRLLSNANKIWVKGFPMNFLGGPGGVKDPNDVWLTAISGKQQHVQAPQVGCPFLMIKVCALAHPHLGDQAREDVENDRDFESNVFGG